MGSTSTCFICADQEIDGIKIKQRSICSDCEEKLIEIFPSDSEYDKYLNKIKSLLFKK